MPEIVYKEALEAYTDPKHEFEVQALSEGLINVSYKVTSKISGEVFLLQQINKKVFPDPLQVQENYLVLWQHAEFNFTGFRMPAPMYFPDHKTFFIDRVGNFWRVFEFLENCYSPTIANSVSQAKATARVFARFTASMKDLDENILHEVIPGFHDLSLRFKKFREAEKHAEAERIGKAEPAIKALLERERYADFYDVITSSDQFPKRVMHHDAKIANVLFSKETGKVVCPVDFDTAMPGFFISDLGDMIRSMVCRFDENHRRPKDIAVRSSFYKAIVNGYVSAMKGVLTPSEIKYIHFSGLAIIYMQALRFLADYLNGDIYYKVSYEGQNLDRAFNQLGLLTNFEEFLLDEFQFKI